MSLENYAPLEYLLFIMVYQSLLFFLPLLAAAQTPSHPFAEGRPDFLFHVQDSHIGHATGDTLRQFAAETNLATVLPTIVVEGLEYLRTRDARPVASIDEWGYSAIQLGPHELDGAGLPRAGFPCFSSVQGCADPASREEALTRLRAYWDARHAHQVPPGAYVISMNGHYYFQHYAAEWGADMVMSEVGENINGTQAHIAFTRGAAKQFNRAWGIDMSPWYGAGVNDYWAEEDRVWCQQRNADGSCAVWHSGPDHGHSISLFERIYYTAYMAGAQYLKAEAGSINFLASKHPPARLSPLGEMAQRFHAFTKAHPDRGEPYVPYAILLDYHHGLGLGSWYKPAGKENVFESIPMNDADRETLQLLETFWPGAFRVQGGDEAQYLVRTPLGDTVDVLLENAPLEALLSYNVLLLAGEITPDTEITERLGAYLARGKTIVFSPSHTPILAALNTTPNEAIGALPTTMAAQCSHRGGSIIQLKDGHAWPTLLTELHQRVVPFQITGDPVHYLLNRRGDSFILTLINNRGVTKQPKAAVEVDSGQSAEISIVFHRASYELGQWWTPEPDQFIGRETSNHSIILAPGEVKIVELVPHPGK